MTLVREWSYDGTELAWLQAGLGRPRDTEGHVVAELVPGGFAAYLRIFHRFEASDGSGRTRFWREWPRPAGCASTPRCRTGRYRTRGGCRTTPQGGWRGRADPTSGRAPLVRALAGDGESPSVYFAYDLAAVMWGEDEPVVRRHSLSRLETVRQEVSAEPGDTRGPGFWWPEDRSWVVTSDHDLLSTYVGCSTEVAQRILGESEIEALPVTPRTRVGWYADRLNPNLSRAASD